MLHILLSLLRDPALRAELVAILREAAPPPSVEPAIHMRRLEYGRSRRISGATVSRLIAQGMPVLRVGTTDRIDPVAADEWRRTTPAAPTTPAKREPDVDVSSALASAGLHTRGGR